MANRIANVLSSIAKQPQFPRVLHDNVIADRNGGTTLSSSDNSAAWQSVTLQQPQRMHMIKHGSVATRAQARALTNTRTVAAKTLASAPDGTVTVALAGNSPKVYTDAQTGVPVAGNPLNDMAEDTDYLENYGDTMTVTLSGNPFVLTDIDGTELPILNQTILVAIAEEKEKRTIWVNRNGRNFPRVFENSSSSSATMVNGLCCHKGGDGNPPGGT